LIAQGVTAVIEGGERRQDSVRNGLRFVDPSHDLVLIHDAARPFVSRGLVCRTAKAAYRHGAAVPAVPVTDTVKIVDRRGWVRETPSRDSIRAAQTPQAVRRALLMRAYQSSKGQDATDDVQLVERAGGRVVAVEGDPRNIKLTTREDLRRAELQR